MTDTLKLWRINELATSPVLVDCPDGKRIDGITPAKDSEGEEIYGATHFDNEIDAWYALDQEWVRGIERGLFRVKLVKDNLAGLEEGLAEAEQKLADVRKNRTEWEQRTKGESE